MKRFTSAEKTILLTIIFLAATILISAKIVSAQVTDKRQRALADVSVTDGFKRVFTNSKGMFNLNTEADSLLISKLGYEQKIISTYKLPATITLIAKPIILEPIKVTTRYVTPFSNALDKTVISSDAERTGITFSETMFRESALNSADVRLAGEKQTLSLLGNLPRHTLVMLDNVPLNPHGEPFDISSLPLGKVTRIEIVKGNASVYGGTSAIGGIVYLYTGDTKTGQPLKLTQDTAIGSFRQVRQRYAFEQQMPHLSYEAVYSWQDARNDFPYQPRPWWNLDGELKRENNRKQQQNYSLQLNSHYVEVSGQYKIDYTDVYRELPGPVNFLALYKKAHLDGQNLRQNLSFDWQKRSIADILILWHNQDDTRYRNTQADNPVYLSDYRQKNSSLGLKSATEYKLEPISINLGLELSRQSYERQDNLIVLQSIGLRKRYQKAASLNLLTESELNYFANKLQAGIRVDDVTEYEPFVSWRLEDVFTFESSFIWQAGAYIGSSFSLPSFYDLYWKGDAQSLGNPDLQPETSLGGSIWTGISYLDNSLKIAYYRSEVKKLIQWHQTYLYGPQWKPLNIGKARLQNWEITASLQPVKWLKLSASTVFTKAVDIDMNANLTYTPDAKGNAGMMLSYLNTVLDLNLDYTGRQWKTRDNVFDPIPAYTLYNAALSRSFSYRKCSSSGFIRLNNLFDKQYEIYDYVPQPGFNWLCGLNLQYRM